MIEFEDISHLVLEVTDLEAATRFYTEALGMEVRHRDEGDLGRGRVIVATVSGQMLFLEKVDELSPRSRFRGPFDKKVPDPDGPPRYSGAHLAMTVDSIAAYDEVHDRLVGSGVFLEGDLRAAERPAGEKSEYFYDPAGNRLQLIIVPGADGAH